MKNIFLVLIIMGLLVACKKDSSNGLIGEWKLIETLTDPGDGSGTFSPVSSSKIIEFHSNGTITSNGDLCSMNSAATSSSSGTYSTIDSIISGSTCTNLHFTLNTNHLIIDYPCIEPCRAKFERQ